MSEKLPLSPEQERQLLDATITKIQGMIEECAQGVSDREADALLLAEPFEDLREWVTDGFARARPKKPDAEGRVWGVEVKRRKLGPVLELKAEPEAQSASFKNPGVQPKDESAAAAQPGPEAEPKAGLPAIIVPPPSSPVWEEAVAVLNKQHAIIENVGGKAVIASWEPSPIDLERLMVVFQSKESFLLRF